MSRPDDAVVRGVIEMNGDRIVRIVEALAEDRGVAPEELRLSLADYIDTDALARLDRGEWRVSFAVEDRVVTVDHTGRVEVIPHGVWTEAIE